MSNINSGSHNELVVTYLLGLNFVTVARYSIQGIPLLLLKNQDSLSYQTHFDENFNNYDSLIL